MTASCAILFIAGLDSWRPYGTRNGYGDKSLGGIHGVRMGHAAHSRIARRIRGSEGRSQVCACW
jgi:hypothetical protein